MADSENLQYKLQTIFDSTGTKEATAEFKKVEEAATKAGEEQVKASDKAFASHKDLRAAVHGLSEEFPMLGQIGRLALHPIGLVVAGIAGAFAIWKTRVQELASTLAGVELPDVSDDRVGRVLKAASAWKEYGDALKHTVDQYNSVEQASARAGKALDAESERQKKLLESRKALELADLERQKSGLAPGQYELAKANIEDFYEQAGIKASREAKQKRLFEETKESDALLADAAKKKQEAANIHVVDEKQEERVLAKSKRAADAADADLEERKKRMKELFDFNEGLMGPIDAAAYPFKYFTRYGSMKGTEAIAQEQQNINTDQGIIDTYNRAVTKSQGRADLRKRRSELESEAGKERGEGENLRTSLLGPGGKLDQFDADNANQDTVARNNALAGAYKASGQVNDKAHEVVTGITRAVEEGTKVMASAVDSLASLHAAQKELDQRIKSLENTRKLVPPGT